MLTSPLPHPIRQPTPGEQRPPSDRHEIGGCQSSLGDVRGHTSCLCTRQASPSSAGVTSSGPSRSPVKWGVGTGEPHPTQEGNGQSGSNSQFAV